MARDSETANKAPADGRHERSRSSRAKIVAAMLELVADGDVAPSAARVAEAAGVGLRTVFRHFDDMDSLYREMSDAIAAKVMPIANAPFTSTGWKEQLMEMAERRATVFETILPYRISANIKRFQSEFLMEDYRRLLRLERSLVDAVLPPALHKDTARRHALFVALSFHTWRLLRHDEELSITEARAVVVRLITDIIAGSKAG